MKTTRTIGMLTIAAILLLAGTEAFARDSHHGDRHSSWGGRTGTTVLVNTNAGFGGSGVYYTTGRSGYYTPSTYTTYYHGGQPVGCTWGGGTVYPPVYRHQTNRFQHHDRHDFTRGLSRGNSDVNVSVIIRFR
ncbi:MAG TPA: hypothetical protein PK082_10525 [Phycisphaerae bacterium]|nr:hypothetical protein [Phycisphaerae bacterium]